MVHIVNLSIQQFQYSSPELPDFHSYFMFSLTINIIVKMPGGAFFFYQPYFLCNSTNKCCISMSFFSPLQIMSERFFFFLGQYNKRLYRVNVRLTGSIRTECSHVANPDLDNVSEFLEYISLIHTIHIIHKIAPIIGSK